MAINSQVTWETYLRALPLKVALHLSSLLDVGNEWEQLASVIPKKSDNLLSDTVDNYDLRYSQIHIQNLMTRNQPRGKSCTRALLNDWGTQNPTVKHLVQALKRANLQAATDFVSNLIGEGERSPKDQRSTPEVISPSVSSRESVRSYPSSNASDFNERVREVKLDPMFETRRVSITSLAKSGVENSHSAPSYEDGKPHEDTCEGSNRPQEGSKEDKPGAEEDQEANIVLQDVQFDVLRKITNNFDDRNDKEGGRLIGSGGFGTVFLGIFNTGFQVAVKCLKDNSEDVQSQFKNELETLCKFKHDNLVLLLGYSMDGETRCLIYQYMCNGSLEDRLACHLGSQPLHSKLRFEIAKGTAKGIAYLHEGGLTHRDIKSANILLDAKFNPKVGDFATARVAPKEAANVTMKASVVIGTHSYLAPEAFSFVIHPGLDCYSYGVVLLEILTGLPVVDPGRENPDIKIHVQEFCAEDDDGQVEGTIHDLLDPSAGDWDSSVVDCLYSISCRCQEPKPKRPKMAAILAELEALTETSAES